MSTELNVQLGTTDIVWQLEDLYHSPDDPTLAADLSACEEEAGAIRAEFAGRLAALEPTALLHLVRRLETLEARLGRAATYAYLNFATQTKDAAAGALLQKIREAGSRASKETVFFELEWSRLEAAVAEQLMAAPELAPYRHHLASLRRYAPHLLSDAEETLLIERAPAGRSSWTTLFDKVMGHLQFGESGRSEEEVLSDLYLPDRDLRRQAAAELTAGLGSQLHVLTHSFNTLLADKMIDDRQRRYPNWLSSMNLYNELNDTTVETLITAVTARYDIPQRYYRLKRQLLGLDELLDYDRYAPLPDLPTTTVNWEQCRKLVLEAFAEFSPDMAANAELFFQRRWIHAPLLEGKRGGAFAHPAVPEVHPYIMVNYTGNLRDISTVAHELGHGVHQYLAAAQGYYNSSTTLVLAETASVFAELLLFKRQLALIEKPEARRAFTCQKLESIFATVFRQIAMNRFEDRVHNARRQEGELSSEQISAQWRASQEEMFADSVRLTTDYDTWWSYIPHFLSTPGYVYSYAFGELLVLALFKLYQQNPADFVPKYLELLKNGGSASPYQLVKPFGVNLDDPAFWAGGLQVIDEMLQEVE
ncbi:M3 family oligoendopeptidase [Desulfurivibrio alkaliphilus]|uniref:Peptidase M3A and M3B thimet/oligopeptidase F n=1 Tax=Desulfurivibrio alkaliphilus (strain DSM 19089 / UNIQEM U267 / AHT2) TaxID=589865 RepID=D6Z293_DESAT|nr:M3 family oligoendopeptidase [Desulfurivibrio alkaliphilus]ADH85668.1 peptidase M3A and M3B thimet/oligopeptidase F [Desulfurivibrio alkaliphilus AHT 2]